MSPSEDGSHSPAASGTEEMPDTIVNDSEDHNDKNENDSSAVDQPQAQEGDSQSCEGSGTPPAAVAEGPTPKPTPQASDDVSSLFSDSTTTSRDPDPASTTNATVVKEGTKDLSSMFGGSDSQESPFGTSATSAPAQPAPTTVVKEGNVDNLGGLFGATVS
eukprot:TRINITY_DN1432_c0_g1_i4.p1 TRINITY_DN1432_c0_g1~~TRINITY_DN1432_c0_g1_i4.p1  ORF type:complete len:161 (-),score=22.61 TRINITY_DN1432_c0_g1_i4:362-844(-)